eukprot:gnl/TRDRNA2_/TRDRNA2_155081_c0_seq6.p1 gnl/TRDRNA2_/TRDRNA2_155081_c0~~gnl/TRDRNA2_/TRDRNA2_155081_c0_seq6.p1  ORF type:complete len:326 (-),score=58.38 gnl/TRDRNA2_/TRDRNA2_155081_c0_seq6:143-1120(-)
MQLIVFACLVLACHAVSPTDVKLTAKLSAKQESSSASLDNTINTECTKLCTPFSLHITNPKNSWKQSVKDFFASIDFNGDGKIALNEWKVGLLKHLNIVSADAVRDLASVDTSGDGVIDYEEFLAAAIAKKLLLTEGIDYRWTEDPVDAHCVTECEMEMFRCYDHHPSTVNGQIAHNSCTDAVKVEVEALANPPKAPAAAPAAAMLVLHKASPANVSNISVHLNAADAAKALEKAIQNKCKQLCIPKDAGFVGQPDSHCVTKCDMELFRCYDHHPSTVNGQVAHNACTDAVEKEVLALANPVSPAPAPAPGPARLLLQMARNRNP